MPSNTQTLTALAEELFAEEEFTKLLDLSRLDTDGLYKWYEIYAFDQQLGGPGVHNIHHSGKSWPGAEGRYHRDDRDIFRCLQYCAVYLHMRDPNAVPWLAREIVHMAGLFLESLTKRVVNVGYLPLGQLLRVDNALIKRKVGNHLLTFTKVYNAAKHTVNQEKDTHLFTAEDAVLAYFVSRRLAEALFPCAKLKTPWSTWQVSTTTDPDDPIWSG